MKGIARGIFVLALSFALGKVVQLILESGAGRSVAQKIGVPALASPKGVATAKRYSKQVSQIAAARFFSEPDIAPKIVEARAAARADWAAALADAADMLVALGTVLRALTEFIRQDQRLSTQIRQTERAA